MEAEFLPYCCMQIAKIDTINKCAQNRILQKKIK